MYLEVFAIHAHYEYYDFRILFIHPKVSITMHKPQTLPPVKIITLTGPSGAGKSSIAKALIAQRPDIALVVSETSRAPRPSDLPGEYRYGVPPTAFRETNRFLETVSVHGNCYGTLQSSIDDALSRDAPSLMILTPSAIGIIRSYAKTRGGGGVASFYIVPPPETELAKRLEQRGDDRTTIEKRITDCRRWNDEARHSSIPYIFISNEEHDAGVQRATEEILRYIQ